MQRNETAERILDAWQQHVSEIPEHIRAPGLPGGPKERHNRKIYALSPQVRTQR